jgi:serine/threonine-protein kinase
METTPHSPRTVEELFEAVLTRPPEERTEYLDRLCGDSPELRELVAMLLMEDERAGDFLESPLLSGSGAAKEKAIAAFEPGTVVCGRFHIHRFIASGGMGEVYEAWDSELAERVAIKTIRQDLSDDREMLDRFRREVKQARSISHTNVCRVHELFCDSSAGGAKTWFLSMEFLDGFSLRERIRHSGPLQPELALEIAEQTIRGVAAAHALGVVHRDLKPGNIMLVSGAPGDVRAVVTDFGLAKNVLRRDAGIPEAGGEGTRDYMAPEQRATADVTALADQYALGVVLCEMLTGRPPSQQDVTTQRTQLRARLTRSFGLRWAGVILRCLEQDPAKRYSGVGDIVSELRPDSLSRRTRAWIAVAACVVLAIAAGVWYRSRTPPAPSTSLAVLPLENRTGDASLDYVGAGVTESLTDDLARMPGLQVVAASVARRYHATAADPTVAGQDMHVGSVVSGVFEQANGKLRIPVELIEVSTGKQIWGQTYEGNPSELADIQREIATDVAYHLKIQVGAETAARLKRQYSTNGPAYDAYLKGRFQLAKRTPDGLREAVSEFQQSLGFDPHYAPALAGLADCYSLLAFYGVENPMPLLKNALKTSEDALQQDSTLGEAYTSRAVARTLLNFDWEGAERDYKRAIELNPSYVQAHAWYALALLAPLGREAEARAQMKYVQSADPDSPLTVAGVPMLEHYGGHIAESIRLLEPHVGGPAPFEPAVETLAKDYLAEGRSRRAIELLKSAPVRADAADDREALLGVAYASAGEEAKAREALAHTLEKVHAGQPLAYEAAEIYSALHDSSRAIEMLQTAFDQRESGLMFINVDPLLFPLRPERGFQMLLKQMNL